MFGELYSQLILYKEDGTLIGKSFSASLLDGARFGKWQKQKGVTTPLGDIKHAQQ